jgi:UDP-GlcNAc:undecaprenyl-phosphate GlcNAc-1-phosphate transferase
MTAPLIALAFPLLDTLLSVVRRFLRGRPIFGADHGHIHHRLLDQGLTPRRVALLLYGVCGLAAAMSIMQSLIGAKFGAVVVLLFCTLVFVGVQRLGYAEFGIGRILLDTELRRHIMAYLSLPKVEAELRLARRPEDCWRVIASHYREFGFAGVELKLRGFSSRAHDPALRSGWTLRIPLSDFDSVALWRDVHDSEPLLGSFADTVSKGLQAWSRRPAAAHAAVESLARATGSGV